VGPWRPILILPPSVVELPPDELRLVLAHELLHVGRGDLWWGLLPAVAQRLFFFHPAAHLAAREYRLAREAACDAAVLRRLDTAPREYGRLLLRLGVVARPAAGVGASSTRGHLERRLQMLEHATRPARRWSFWLAIPVVLGLVIPIRLVARDAGTPDPSAARDDPRRPAAMADVVTAPPAEEWILLADDSEAEWEIEEGERDEEGEWTEREWDAEAAAEREERAVEREERAREREERALARQEAERERAERAREREAEAREREMRAHERAERERSRDAGRWRWSDDATWNGGDGVSFVLLTGDETSMHGSSWDVDAARRHRRGGEDLLFLRREDGDWVVRDREVVTAAREIFEPQRELGRRQAALGSKQAELGERQAALGAQQAELGTRMRELGAGQAELGARTQELVATQLEIQSKKLRLASRGEEARSEEIEARRRELEQRLLEVDRQREEVERQMRELGHSMRTLGGGQGELGSRQAALGAEQAKLGARQAELGAAQRRAAEAAHADLLELVERAIASGVAERVER
jgi:peptidoglycan hydrolase CwlO-like protein